MDLKKELKILSSVGKKILDKKKLKKIKKIKDDGERKNLYEHAIKRELELKVMDFRKEVKKLEKEGKEVFFIKVKINLLKLKISYFIVKFSKKDFTKISKLIKRIETDLKHV